MHATSTVTLVALVNGMGFPVRHFGPDGMVVAGFPAGLNPFHPYGVGDVVPVTVVAEQQGRREAMALQARLDDAFAGEATFSLPFGMGVAVPAPDVTLAFPALAGGLDDLAISYDDFDRPYTAAGDGLASEAPPLPPVIPPMSGPGVDPYSGRMPGPSAPTWQARPTGPAAPGGRPAGIPVPPRRPVPPGMALTPSNGVYDPYGAPGYTPDRPDLGGTPPHIADSTEREELSRLAQTTAPTVFVPTGPTVGMAQVPVVAPGTAVAAPTVTELPDDDEKSSGSAFGRGALFLVLGTLALLTIGALMLLQRSGVQSVQAALRGQTTDITAPADGRIVRMTVSEGSDVQAGQELFSLDAGTQGASLDEMRVDVEDRTRMMEQTQAALDEARRLVSSGGGSDAGSTTTIVSGGGTTGGGATSYSDPIDPARVAAAEARVGAARVRAQETAGALTRAQRLFDGGALTRSDLEGARANAEAASAELAAREADLRSASTPTVRSRGGSTRTGGTTTRVIRSGGDRSSNRLSAQLRLLDLERDLMRQQTELRQAELRLDQAMRVPQGGKTASNAAGVVATVYRNAGSVVRAGDPVLSIETTDQPSVIAYFPFSEARLIRGGAEANVTFPAVRQSVEGRVDAIGAAALGSWGNRSGIRNDQDLTPVRIRLNRLPPNVAPGAQADASVEVGLRTVFLGRLH